MTTVLLTAVLLMIIIVLSVKYWRIFKWALLGLASLALWMLGAAAIIILIKSLNPGINDWLVVIGGLSWPILAWVIRDSMSAKKS